MVLVAPGLNHRVVSRREPKMRQDLMPLLKRWAIRVHILVRLSMPIISLQPSLCVAFGDAP